ncbi:hypothetical protein [Mycobacterium tuberculosis]|uniref:hypothetical protein n=1 Tax=Mycobacterium tuberculosis TaxID=1773 RepID=UPI00272CF6B4|nr:hypothetical protein [Mycobacterium tuberculosis]
MRAGHGHAGNPGYVGELNGSGESVGGIVVMRSGKNALNTIEAVKAKLESLKLGELNGSGESVGGIVVMRSGKNALNTIEAVKAKRVTACRWLAACWRKAEPLSDLTGRVDCSAETGIVGPLQRVTACRWLAACWRKAEPLSDLTGRVDCSAETGIDRSWTRESRLGDAAT